MEFLNAIVALSNYVLIPAIAYGSQLALGALGVTLIYGILRFSNFAHGDTMAFGAMVTILFTWLFQSWGISIAPLPTALLALPFGIMGTAILLLFTDRVVYRFYRKQKAAPVILVIDTVGMTRGIAPLLLGYREFDRDINLAGVILNNVGGARHEGKLRAAVEAYSDIPVIGSVWRTSTLTIGERHLGLITPGEAAGPSAVIAGFGEVIKGSVDIDRVVKIAQSAPQLKPAKKATLPASAKGLRIGIARDAAFGFYYSDDLEYFDRIGVELVPINMLEEGHLPDIDGLFIGGGFPETHLEELAKNQAMLKSVKTAIVAGLPTYAECGGLMYLCRSLDWNGLSRNLASVIPANAIMCTKPQGRGYTVFSPTPDHPWYAQGQSIPGHEFHYARLDNLPADISYGCKVARGAGIDGHHDGIVAYNLLASFCHLRNTAANPWIERFVDFVQTCKRGRPSHSSGAS